MFNRDKGENTEQYVTRAQWGQYRTDIALELRVLGERLAKLEALARQLRTNGQMAAEAQVAAAPAVRDDALTLRDASVALDSLKSEALAQFRQTRDEIAEVSAYLGRKVDDTARAVVGQVSASQEVMSDTNDVRMVPGVDYGAIAFGLSELARKIGPMVGGSVDADAFVSECKGAVQYFADVFAKADATFNEAEFKRQAGV